MPALKEWKISCGGERIGNLSRLFSWLVHVGGQGFEQ